MAAYSHYPALAPTQRAPNARAIVNAPQPRDGGSDRRWLAETTGAETYLGALARMVFHPTKFAVTWTQGAKAISPLKFVAVSTTVVLVATQLVQHGETSTTLVELISSVTPTIVFALLGLLIHAAYKAVGSQRSLETSLGLTLFTIAGPGLFFPLMLVGTMWFAKHYAGEKFGVFLGHQDVRVQFAVLVASTIMYLWPRVVLGRVLHAVHRRRWWWTALAIVFAELAVALLFGMLLQVGVDEPELFKWPRLVISPDLQSYGIFW